MSAVAPLPSESTVNLDKLKQKQVSIISSLDRLDTKFKQLLAQFNGVSDPSPSPKGVEPPTEQKARQKLAKTSNQPKKPESFDMSRIPQPDSSDAWWNTFSNNSSFPQYFDRRTPQHLDANLSPSPVVHRLFDLCKSMNISPFQFIRVDPDYYSFTLEQRQAVLQAPSLSHLCKTVIMANTHYSDDIEKVLKIRIDNNSRDDIKKLGEVFLQTCLPPLDSTSPKLTLDNYPVYLSDIFYPRIICVLVNYTHRLHKAKLLSASYQQYVEGLNTVKSLTNDSTLTPVSKGVYDGNWRLADGEEAHAITSYKHNAVVPLGFVKPLPVYMCDSIATLGGGNFFLGGGEVDVKWRSDTRQFIASSHVVVADLTHAYNPNDAVTATD
jgi:hypothetical protein